MPSETPICRVLLPVADRFKDWLERELHLFASDDHVSVCVWQRIEAHTNREGDYMPDSGIVIAYDKVDEFIEALRTAKSAHECGLTRTEMDLAPPAGEFGPILGELL